MVFVSPVTLRLVDALKSTVKTDFSGKSVVTENYSVFNPAVASVEKFHFEKVYLMVNYYEKGVVMSNYNTFSTMIFIVSMYILIICR